MQDKVEGDSKEKSSSGEGQGNPANCRGTFMPTDYNSLDVVAFFLQLKVHILVHL
jgi:hypothetical protein